MSTVIKMGKRGTLVLPIKLRKQFALDDGSLLITEAKDGGISLRPAVAYEVETYTPERKAELLLSNAVTKEDWDETYGLLVAEGIEPTTFPSIDLTAREVLPSDVEWRSRIQTAQRPEMRKLSA